MTNAKKFFFSSRYKTKRLTYLTASIRLEHAHSQKKKKHVNKLAWNALMIIQLESSAWIEETKYTQMEKKTQKWGLSREAYICVQKDSIYKITPRFPPVVSSSSSNRARAARVFVLFSPIDMPRGLGVYSMRDCEWHISARLWKSAAAHASNLHPLKIHWQRGIDSYWHATRLSNW